MMTTYTAKKSEINQNWHLVDAKGIVLGNLATEIAKLLTGKHKPIYTPTINTGDSVVVINAKDVAISGNKLANKEYKRYTGYPGAVKVETLGRLMERNPSEVIRRAVKGMLPKNKLAKQRMRNLYIYDGPEHPHSAQIRG